jgi:hypothetical protein
VGHIRLDLCDIEFVQNDEIVLDEADVILIEERPQARVRHLHAVRPFDDAETRVWSRAAHGFR